LDNATIHYNSTEPEQISYKRPPVIAPPEISIESAQPENSNFVSLWENTVYNIYVMNDRNAENPLSSENLIYITQTVSDENGEINAEYITEKFPDKEIFAVCALGDKETEQEIEVIKITDYETSLDVPENTLYVSSSPDIATIDEDGKVTPVSNGRTAVIAITENENELAFILEVSLPEREYILGDANGDGKITLKDAVIIQRYIAGGWGVEIDEKIADVNKDDKVNLKDAVLIQRYVAGGWNIELK